MIRRTLHDRLLQVAEWYPVVTVTGPRQSGKTTLCRAAFPQHAYVSLEAPDTREYATRDPRGLLRELRDGAVIDEVQRVPDLLSYLQVDVDERPERGRFILTGSQHLGLLGTVSQSLAGRTGLLHLLPASLDELRLFPAPTDDLLTVLWQGGYPAIHDRRVPPAEWLGTYVATYVERDVRQVLNVGDLLAFQTFLRMCAGRSAQLLNLSALGADCGINHNTARAWLSVLEATFVAHRLPPWLKSLRKRLVRTPKLHFFDSGLACYLLGIRSPEELRHHPLRGALFESWLVSEVVKARLHRGLPAACSFYRDRKGNELDLVVERGERCLAVEAKSGETVADDALRSLARVAGLLAADPLVRVVEPLLVYGGGEAQRRTAATVLPWSTVCDYDWAGPSPGAGDG